MFCNNSIIRKIRKEIIKTFSFHGFFLGDHYYISNNPKAPIFYISTGSENRYQSGKLKTFLEKNLSSFIKVNLIDQNNLSLDISLLCQKKSRISKKFLKQRDIIIQLLCEGYSQKTIIEKLKFSVGGFHDLKKRVLMSINCKNIADIIVYALRNGLCTVTTTFKEPVRVTEKEKGLILSTCMGKSDKKISEEVDLSVYSIPVYRNRLLKRIGGKSSADIIIYAFKNNIFN